MTIKQKKCAWCKKLFTPHNSMQKFCSYTCSYKNTKNKKKVVIRTGGRTCKVGVKTAKNRAWKAFSAHVRSKSDVCYTCGKKLEFSERQCGHGIGGRGGAVLFDEEICRTQCAGCNVFLRGNYQVFITKLIKEHGMEWWENKLTGSKMIVKYSTQDYLDIESKYKND